MTILIGLKDNERFVVIENGLEILLLCSSAKIAKATNSWRPILCATGLEEKIFAFARNEKHARATILCENPQNVRPFVDQR